MILKEGKTWISRPKREGKRMKNGGENRLGVTLVTAKKQKSCLESAYAYTRVRNSSTLLDGRLVTRGRRSGDMEREGLLGKGKESLEEESLGEESLGQRCYPNILQDLVIRKSNTKKKKCIFSMIFPSLGRNQHIYV